MKKFVFLFSLIILSSFFLLPQSVRAQSLGLGIYPPLLEVMIMPGKSITQVYNLANTGDLDLVMKSAIVGFEPSDEIGQITLIEDTEKLQPLFFDFLNADLRLGQTFSLPSGTTQEVVLIVKVPETAPEKDYYITLLFQTAPMKGFGGLSASQTQTKIGTNLLLTVSRTGKPSKKAAIKEFQLINCAKLCIIDSFTQPQFKVNIKNTGHFYFKPLGNISLQGWLNQKESLDLLPQNILSDYSREIQCQESSESEPEKTMIPCQIKSKFLLGPFKAKLEFGLDDFSGEYQQEIRFIALPIKLTIAFIILIIFLGLIKKKLGIDKTN